MGIERAEIARDTSARFTLDTGDVLEVINEGDKLSVRNIGKQYASGLVVTPRAQNAVDISVPQKEG